MKTVLFTLTLSAALTSAALAGSPTPAAGDAPTTRQGPMVLSEAQMDTVTAGGSSVGNASGGDCITRYGNGAGVDPSIYGGGAGADPSVFGAKPGTSVDIET